MAANRSIDSRHESGKSSLNLPRTMGDSNAAAATAFARGITAAVAGDESVFPLLTTALALWDRTGLPSLDYARALYHLSNHCCERKSDYLSALSFAARSLAHLDALDQGDGGVMACRSDSEDARGNALTRLGRTTEAIAAHTLSMALAERLNDSARIVRSLINAAWDCRVIGKHDQGLIYLQRAESLNTPASKGSRHLTQRLRLFQPRGTIFKSMGRYSEALISFQSAVDVAERLRGRQSIEVAISLSLMSLSQVAIGHTALAVTSSEAGLVIYESLGLTNDGCYGDALISASCAQFAQGSYELALGYAERCLTSRRKLYPPSHPSIYEALSAVSLCLSSLGRDDEAERAQSAANAIKRRSQTACAGPGCARKCERMAHPLTCVSYAGAHVTAGRRARRPIGRRGTRRSARCWLRRQQ